MTIAKKHANLLTSSALALASVFGASQAGAQDAPYAHTLSRTTPYQRNTNCAGTPYYADGRPRCTFYYNNEADDLGDVWARYTAAPKMVAYSGTQTDAILIDHKNNYLYLPVGNGKAIQYVITVGREGMAIEGDEFTITRMALNPDWRPTERMLHEDPNLRSFYRGGPDMPLGSAALYLGNTLYRIHGTNDPKSLGKKVSSGCIRMHNKDILDLYKRAKVGMKVLVFRDGTTLANQISALPKTASALKQ